MSIQLWDGNINDFYSTNMNNYQFINSLIKELNNNDKFSDLVGTINWSLDTTNYDTLNRFAYQQLINNAIILKTNLPSLVETVRVQDYQWQCPVFTVPDMSFDKDKINSFWSAVNETLTFILGQLTYL